MRLIDADALDREMYRKSFEVDDGRNVWNSGLWIRYKIFEEAIRDAPTVDAVPVRHGRWTPHEEMSDEWNCSETWYRCQCGYDTRRKTPYCPMCGARMEED